MAESSSRIGSFAIIGRKIHSFRIFRCMHPSLVGLAKVIQHQGTIGQTRWVTESLAC